MDGQQESAADERGVYIIYLAKYMYTVAGTTR